MTLQTDPPDPAGSAEPEPRSSAGRASDDAVAAATEPAAPADPVVAAEPAAPADPSADPTALDRAAAAQPPAPPAGGPRRRTGALVVAGALVAILAGTALFLSGWTLGRQAAHTPGTPVSEADAWQPFWDTYSAITERYAGAPVDRSALIQGAIKGMIAALNDPFSQYLTADEFKQSLQGISGQFSGIGATDRHH